MTADREISTTREADHDQRQRDGHPSSDYAWPPPPSEWAAAGLVRLLVAGPMLALALLGHL